MTDVRLTQGTLEAMFDAGALDVKLTQGVLEVLYVSAVATVSGASLVLSVSGIQVTNAIGLKPLTVSASWSITGASAGAAYQWVFELPAGSSTSANITRSFSAFSGVPGRNILSAVVTLSAAFSSSVAIYVKNAGFPNSFDGNFIESNQPKRRVFP